MRQEFDCRTTVQIEHSSLLQRAFAICLLICSAQCLLGIPLNANAASSADKSALFEQVFGPKDPAAETSIPVEMIFDGRETGLVTIVIANDGAFRVETAALIRAITTTATEQALAALRAFAAQSRLVRPDELGVLGIQLNYDPARLRLTVVLDPKLRSRRNINIKGDRYAGSSQAPQAADFSLYMNLNGSSNFAHASESGSGGWQSSNVRLETVAQLHGWVFESEAFYQSATVDHWRRGGLRLVRDNVDRSTRLVIGDQHWPAQALMGGHQLAGLALFKNFAIQPYTVIQPSGYHEFFLDSASTVEIYVNNTLTRTLTLDPGAYSVSDLPLAYGANDFRLRIVDSFGQESVFDADIYSASRLLAMGMTEFALSAGFRSSYLSGSPEYDVDDPLLAGFYRSGLSDTTTLGLAVSVSTVSWLMSGQAALATPFGNVTINVGAGQEYNDNPGIAAQIGYRHYQKLRSGRGDRSWDFSALVLSRDYLGAMTGTATPTRHSLSMRIAQPVTARSYISLSANYQSRHDSAGIYSAALSISYRFRTGLNIRLSASQHFNDINTPGSAFSLSYSYPFGNSRQNIQGDFDSRSNRRSTSWQRSPPSSDIGVSSSFGYTEDRDNRFLDGLLAFNGSRFEASLEHNYSENLLQSSGVSQTTRVNYSTALAMASGRFAITRRITDSFAIAVPHENYSKFDIGLKLRNSDRESISGLFGSAIASRLTSYETHQLEVNVDNLPLGYDLHNTNPMVTPKYRSGVIVAVGNAASIILRGRLMAGEGTALKLRSGILRFLGDEASAPIRFFTNRNGRFTISGIQPGPYEILLEASGESAEILIPSDALGVLNYGDLRL